MKSVTAYLIAALVFVAVGVVALTASRLERNLADAQEQTTTQQYALAQKSLDAADGRLRYARWVPRVGDETVREVRARQAALQYWQGDYAKVLQYYAQAAELYPGDPSLLVSARNNIGNALRALKKFPEAEAEFERAHTLARQMKSPLVPLLEGASPARARVAVGRGVPGAP